VFRFSYCLLDLFLQACGRIRVSHTARHPVSLGPTQTPSDVRLVMAMTITRARHTEKDETRSSIYSTVVSSGNEAIGEKVSANRFLESF
jgi:hypothetical protein